MVAAERALLLFPLCLTTLTVLALLCRVQCTWLILAISFVFSFAALGWPQRKFHPKAVLLWLAFFAGVWLLGQTILPYNFDHRVYQLPAIRLLMAGWNPFDTATPEALQQTWGVSDNEFRIYHVMFMPRTTWYYCATMAKVIANPFNLTTSLTPFLLLGMAGPIWRLFRDWARWMRVALILGIFFICGNLFLSAPLTSEMDLAVMCASIGLMCCLVDALRKRKLALLPTLFCTYWLAGAKHLGLLNAVVLWGLFAILAIVSVRRQLWYAYGRSMVRLTLILVPLLVLAWASPLLTSWRTYGHPLYPQYRGESCQAATYDLTEDLKLEGNKDWREMSHFATFCNAYLAPELVACYYKIKLGQDSFVPRNNAHNIRSALFIHLCAFPILILLFIGDRRERLLLLMACAAAILMPRDYIGYERYQLTLPVLLPLASLRLVRWVPWRFLQRSLKWAICLVLMFTVGVHVLFSIESTRVAHQILVAGPTELYNIGMLMPFKSKNSSPLYPLGHPYYAPSATISVANLRLLQASYPPFAQVKILPMKRRSLVLPVFPSMEFVLEKRMTPLVATSYYQWLKCLATYEADELTILQLPHHNDADASQKKPMQDRNLL